MDKKTCLFHVPDIRCDVFEPPDTSAEAAETKNAGYMASVSKRQPRSGNMQVFFSSGIGPCFFCCSVVFKYTPSPKFNS